jgi:predicted DNA repair protein MutK
MASGFFAILDDIAALMDDVAINAKLATKKTAGILGDDLAVNAEKSTGLYHPEKFLFCGLLQKVHLLTS